MVKWSALVCKIHLFARLHQYTCSISTLKTIHKLYGENHKFKLLQMVGPQVLCKVKVDHVEGLLWTMQNNW